MTQGFLGYNPPMTRPALCAVVAVAALLLSGCSNNPYPPGETASSTLYRYLTEDPKSLDPSFSYTVDEAYICDLIYPSFYKYHYLKQTPFQLVLNLGAKDPVRQPAPDGKGEVWTFTLKPGLRFADDPCFPGGKGRAIDARDVVYSFQRMADPSVQCPVASFFADKVVGWRAYSDGFKARGKAHYDDPMEGVQVDPNNPLTLRLRLSQAYPQLRYLMAMHFTTPQAREAVEKYGDEYARHPVGCGPYRMTAYQPKQRILMEVNPNRHPDLYPGDGDPGDREAGLLADAGKPLPRAQRIVYSIIKESTSRWNLFMQGYLDGETVNSNNFQQAMGSSGLLSPALRAKGIVLRKSPQVNIYYLAFNMNDATWGGLDEKHRKLRQAVSLAVDAREFIDLFRQGDGVPAQWLLPPSVFGYDKSFQNPYRTLDIERAKKLLAEAGFANGIDPKTGQKLVLGFDNTATTAAGRNQTGWLIKQIERIGIKVESRATPYNVFQDKLLKGQHQFILYGWFADYPDPENFVFLLYGPNKRPGPNSSNYANPEYDRLFEQMRAMDDGPARRALIVRMRQIAVEDCPWIPIYHEETRTLAYDWLTNVKAHPIANDFAQYRGVDFVRRAERQRAWNRPIMWPLAVLATLAALAALPAAGVVRRRINRRVRVQDGGQGR